MEGEENTGPGGRADEEDEDEVEELVESNTVGGLRAISPSRKISEIHLGSWLAWSWIVLISARIASVS